MNRGSQIVDYHGVGYGICHRETFDAESIDHPLIFTAALLLRVKNRVHKSLIALKCVIKTGRNTSPCGTSLMSALPHMRRELLWKLFQKDASPRWLYDAVHIAGESITCTTALRNLGGSWVRDEDGNLDSTVPYIGCALRDLLCSTAGSGVQVRSHTTIIQHQPFITFPPPPPPPSRRSPFSFPFPRSHH